MWLAPGFLLGLLALGLPLWLHRFARHVQLRRAFASLMLLEPSEIQHSRKRQLRYLWLLALRIALLALLALAFAEPVLRTTSSLPTGGGSILHVVVLDTSLSMQQGDRWQRAVGAATRIIDQAAAGDRLVLVAADYRVRVIHESVPGSASAELRAALTALKPGLARLDYGMLMTSADAWIGTRGEHTQLHFITDVQQSAAPLRFADLAPPPGVQLQVIDVGDHPANNAYIDHIGFIPQDASAISVRVQGAQAAGPAREVILSIDGAQRGRKPVSALKGESIEVIFPAVELGAGQHRVVATLEPGDALVADDRYYATLEHSEPRVLLVAANPNGDDASYLAAAVGSLTGPRLAIDKAVPAALDTRARADYSAIFIGDAGLLSGAAAENLKRYVTSGGAVLMTLGARAAAQPKVAITDQEITRSLDGNEQAMRVAELEQSHPVLRDSSGWRGIRFFRYVPVAARSGDAVLMRLESGVPLLIETPLGQGRVLVLTSALERAWNDLALHPLFVRFIAEAARYLTGVNAQRTSGIVGSTLTAGLHNRSGAQVFDPTGERVLSLSDTAGATQVLATQPGFYEVRGGGRVEWLGVNVDARESDLTALPPEAVQRWQALQHAAAGTQQPPNSTPNAASTEPKLLPVWFWLLLGAILLAFLEPLVANYHLHVQRERTS